MNNITIVFDSGSFCRHVVLGFLAYGLCFFLSQDQFFSSSVIIILVELVQYHERYFSKKNYVPSQKYVIDSVLDIVYGYIGIAGAFLLTKLFF